MSNQQPATSNRVDVISFSGGRTSAYLVWLFKDNPNARFVYCDTGAEHPKTYEFIKKTAKEFRIDLVCIRAKFNMTLGQGNSYEIIPLESIGYDLSVWSSMMQKYGTPYLHGAFCTDRMKTTPYTKYCNATFGAGNYTSWFGIRADEPRRLTEKPGIRYLAEIDDAEKEDILDFWDNQTFNLELDEHLGNCVFCIKKGINKVALAAKDEPFLATEFISAIESPKTRIVDSRIVDSRIMYRGNNSLRSIIDMYDDVERDDLASRLRNQRSYDSNSCSESCEAFACQLSLF